MLRALQQGPRCVHRAFLSLPKLNEGQKLGSSSEKARAKCKRALCVEHLTEQFLFYGSSTRVHCKHEHDVQIYAFYYFVLYIPCEPCDGCLCQNEGFRQILRQALQRVRKKTRQTCSAYQHNRCFSVLLARTENRRQDVRNMLHASILATIQAVFTKLRFPAI